MPCAPLFGSRSSTRSRARPRGRAAIFAASAIAIGVQSQVAGAEPRPAPPPVVPLAPIVPLGLLGVAPPPIPVPPGYGHYCSVSDGAGGWAFEFGDVSSDPCGDILSRFKTGIVRRAGLWSMNGDNNVMVRCGTQKETVPYRVRGAGAALVSQAFSDNKNAKNCIFIVSPTALPIFGHPWAPMSPAMPADFGVKAGETGFNYDLFNAPWDVTAFGQSPIPAGSKAGMVDRHGVSQAHFGSAQECLQAGKGAGCLLVKPGAHAVEGAYDWSMEEGRPLLAVAPGVVRGARNRNVTGMCGKSDFQAEIFIESQVGAGRYAETFVAAYHHMIKLTSNPADNVQAGQIVHRGERIARIGNTGCSSEPHLDLSVLRTSNLTGIGHYAFQALPVNANEPPSFPNVYGVNGVQGAIDPFGWAAPKEIDPYAWKFINFSDANFPNAQIPGLTEPGAYSINLWIPGQAPPSY